MQIKLMTSKMCFLQHPHVTEKKPKHKKKTSEKAPIMHHPVYTQKCMICEVNAFIIL